MVGKSRTISPPARFGDSADISTFWFVSILVQELEDCIFLSQHGSSKAIVALYEAAEEAGSNQQRCTITQWTTGSSTALCQRAQWSRRECLQEAQERTTCKIAQCE
jgi:hypothetical protein